MRVLEYFSLFIFVIGVASVNDGFCLGEESPYPQRRNIEVNASPKVVGEINIYHKEIKSEIRSGETDLKVESVIYPSECFLGDTIYHQLRRTNEGEKTVSVRGDAPISQMEYFWENTKFVISFCSNGDCVNYTFIPEIYRNRDKSVSYKEIVLKPDELSASAIPLELPVLEAFEHPFWQKVIDKIDGNGIRCELIVSLSSTRLNHKEENYHKYFDYKHEILIKPRSDKEYQLLKEWRQKVPSTFLPQLSNFPLTKELPRYYYFWQTDKYNDFSKNGYQKSNGNFIEVGGQKYNPWFFIRDGNRKPPAQICPTTAKGWLELEKQFQPSTLRDEIQLVRMLIEYFDATDEQQQRKNDEIVNWLKSLPKPQQMSMSSWIADRAFFGLYAERMPDSIRDRYKKLATTIEPMTSHYYKEESRRRANRQTK
jgi:hypothetical protein